MSKRNAVTRKIELVETHNIALSLNRLFSVHDTYMVKRALYHALCMGFYGLSVDVKRKIREALELP